MKKQKKKFGNAETADILSSAPLRPKSAPYALIRKAISRFTPTIINLDKKSKRGVSAPLFYSLCILRRLQAQNSDVRHIFIRRYFALPSIIIEKFAGIWYNKLT